MRDHALLHIGFFGTLRRSELVALQVEHLQWKVEGIDIQLPSSKMDQTHEGQLSMHSLRRGLATSAAQQQMSIPVTNGYKHNKISSKINW